jgi:hypothetical protein
MKTAIQIAGHPKARLHREIVERLRAFRSVEGAKQAWLRFRENPRLWKRIVTYGLAAPERQAKLNRIAFPETNFAQVDAALKAGNNLNRIHELALGLASIATDSAGHSKMGRSGLKIVKHPRSDICPMRPT